MKRFAKIALALLLVCAALFASGCGSGTVDADPSSSLDFGEDVTYVSDTLYYTYFLAFNNEPEQYNGKKFAVDGMFHMNKYEGGETPMLFRYHLETDPSDGKEYAYYRGFMLKGDAVKPETEEKAWIRVVGTLETEQHGDHAHVYLNVESFELLETQGQEYVE